MAHIEINDLVGKAIANAGERRNRALTEAGLSDLSSEEMNQITGGAALSSIANQLTIRPIIAGFFPPSIYIETFKSV